MVQTRKAKLFSKLINPLKEDTVHTKSLLQGQWKYKLAILWAVLGSHGIVGQCTAAIFFYGGVAKWPALNETPGRKWLVASL